MTPLWQALGGLGALLLGGVLLGWPGVVLALAGVMAVLMARFLRLMRVLRLTAEGPTGVVGDAAALHARLRPGMALVDVLAQAGSAGEPVPEAAHTYRWRDAGGAVLILTFDARGRLSRIEPVSAS
ncbi:MAG: hypothetical protein ACK520_02080 [Inhella sp.]|jgi:hypothetical protein|uniref:hypothetical protein n=1 Tax=Inhella sp. TaxID=1921806 RepID=UPI0022C1F8F2|nr:hypothetical protein [Inhella sp.]MCZ8235042.1 hypothetical protein [Inhella sp.]